MWQDCSQAHAIDGLWRLSECTHILSGCVVRYDDNWTWRKPGFCFLQLEAPIKPELFASVWSFMPFDGSSIRLCKSSSFVTGMRVKLLSIEHRSCSKCSLSKCRHWGLKKKSGERYVILWTDVPAVSLLKIYFLFILISGFTCNK